MDVVSDGPLCVTGILWQTRSGEHTLTVICKATYQLEPNASPLAREQDELNERDQYWNDDERRSLHLPSDLVPFKQRADIWLMGHAYAPLGQPVGSLVAELRVGGLDKSIEVFRDRAFARDGTLVQGPPFVKMPLRWERAAGGPNTANPVGVGADTVDARGMHLCPNLQPPGLRIKSPLDRIPPIGFGPIAPSWPGRLSRRKESASTWDRRTWHLRPLPPDLDPAFFNAAPPDQQVSVLRAHEGLTLINLHPKYPRLETTLGAATPHAVVERKGGSPEEFVLRCDTLAIDTDRGTCSLTWRAAVPLRHPGEQGRVVVRQAQAGRSSRSSRGMGMTQEVTPPKRDRLPTLPFLTEGEEPASNAPEQGAVFDDEMTVDLPALRPGAALPFSSGRGELGRTQDAPVAGAQPALPFRVGRSPLMGSVLGAVPLAPAVPEVPEVPVPEMVQEEPILDEEDTVSLNAEESAVLMGEAAPVLPPPLIGPLAKPEMVVPSAIVDEPTEETTTETKTETTTETKPETKTETKTETTSETKTETTSEASEPVPEAPLLVLDIEKYPIERCAAIAASRARRRDESAQILEEHELDEARWKELEEHWKKAMLEESERGKTTLLEAYDSAYVAQIEKERGVIELEQYAGLVVASERGTLARALAALEVPGGAMMRIERVWMRKVASDRALGKSVRRAIQSARVG